MKTVGTLKSNACLHLLSTRPHRLVGQDVTVRRDKRVGRESETILESEMSEAAGSCADV